ncbi:MAG: C50 family peptidase [Lachnospiraceae bacterium]|nr:C50 family peptidase [Lachnospiraceae bacterium]
MITGKGNEIKEAIYKMSMAELIAIQNEYSEKNNDPNGYIYPMEMFDEMFSNLLPSEILRMCKKHFSIDDGYFSIDECGLIISFDEPDDLLDILIFPGDIASYAEMNEDSLHSDTIKEILEEE